MLNMRQIRIALSTLLTLICLGCGGGSSTSAPATTGGSNNASVVTGTVRLQSVLARTVPSTVTHFRATGFDLNGAVQFGPETVSKATTVEFIVPVTVTRLQIEYLAGSQVVGIGSSTVAVVASQVTELANFDFQDVNVALNQLSLNPPAPSLASGTSLQLTALGTFGDNSQRDLSSSVSWTSSDTAVATVSSTGLVTSLTPGTSSISVQLGTVSNQVNLTVTSATVTSINVSPNPQTLAVGTSGQLTATATFSDGSQQDVTSTANWNSSAPANATVNASGTVSSIGVGQTTITASFGGQSGEALVVTTAASLNSIVVSPANPTVAAGTTQQMTATGQFSDGSTQNLTSSVNWSSQNTAFVTVDATGLSSGVAPGSAAVTASLGGVNGQTDLTVSSAVVSSLVVTPPVPAVALGTTQQLIATALFSDGSQQDVTNSATWTSAAPAVAGVNGSGLATSLSSGQSTVSAQFNGLSSSATLTVTDATVASLVLSPANPSLASGTSVELQAVATFSDGTQQDVSSRSSWTSATPATASVSPSGLVSALNPGTSQMTAQFGGQMANTLVTVTPATINSITVTPNAPAIAVGSTQQFTATANLSDGNSQDVTNTVSWTSTTPVVATVNTSGLSSSVSPGQTSISATLGGVSGTATLTVSPATLTSLSLSPFNPAAVAGFTQPMTATATFSDGSTQNVTSSAVWTSETVAVATVTSPGQLLGVSPGTSLIRASFGGQTVSTTFTVSPVIVTNIIVTPPNPAVAQGATLQMTAVAHFSDGTTRDITSSGAIWFSTNPAILSVSPSGLLTGVAPGQTRVNANFQLVANTTVTVTTPSVTSLSLTPNSPTIAQGQTQQFTVQANFSDGTTQNVSSSANWSSATPAVASISNLGLASGLTSGSSLIGASFGGMATSTTLTVSNPIVSRIDVTPTAPLVPNGTTRQLTATATFSDGSTQDVTNLASWNSTVPGVAAVSATGLVTTVGAGQSFMEASFGGRTGASRVTVTVPDPTITGISVEPAAAMSAQGTTRQYRAVASFSDGSTQDVTSQVTWSSSNTQVTVANDTFGLNRVGQARIAEGTADGSTATITATLGALNATSSLTVHHYLFVSNEFSGTANSYAINDDGTLTAAQLNQTVPARASEMAVDPSGRYLYIAHNDTSLLSAHRIQADGSLVANGTISTGRFPRRVVISPDGRFLFLINAGDRAVGAFRIAADGTLSANGALTHPDINFSLDLHMDPQGRCLYYAGANLVVVAIASDGTLSHRQTIPGFTVSLGTDSSGENLYVGDNTGGGSVASYTVAGDGTLTANGRVSTANVGANSLVVEGRDRFVYVTHSDTSDVTAYQIEFDGSLTALGLVANNPPGLTDSTPLRAEKLGRTFYHANPTGSILPFRIEPSGQITPLTVTNGGSQTNGLALTP